MLINKFSRTPENPERGGRHQFALHQKAVFKEPCKRTHTLAGELCTHAHVCTNTHGCTMKRPTFSVTLKKTSLPRVSLICPLPYMCVRVHPSHTHVHTHGQSNVACFPPKQHANSAWKLRDGRRGTHLLQLDIFHGNCILMWASQRRHVWHTDPMAEIILEQCPDKKEQGEGGLKSCLLWHFPCQTEPRKGPWKSRAMFYVSIFVPIICFHPKLRGHDLDKQSMIRTEEADITDNWRLSLQAFESCIASFNVNCCLF